MVSIYVNGIDKTRQISDWTIKGDGRGGVSLTCHYPSGKSWPSPLAECEVVPTREVKHLLLRKKSSSVISAVESAVIYGEKYAVVQYSAGGKKYAYKLADIEFTTPTKMKDDSVFQYFRSVADARVIQAESEKDKVIAENVQRQFDSISACASTALHAYCTGRNGSQEPVADLIFPFGLNESQLEAVEQAFTSQISLIEGPPGTGKTQTILNIVANILLRGKTVAVVSNNNAAVSNVCEKLGKSGLDYLVAELGSNENREAFFANPRPRPTIAPEAAPEMANIQSVFQKLKCYLADRNTMARLQAEVSELEIERSYLRQWQQESGVLESHSPGQI